MPLRSINAAPKSTPVDDDSAWLAVQQRDRHFDGSVYYAVKTTGVYCLPSCPARKPKRSHVAFYASPSDAEGAGYRPCKRCKPDEAPEHAAWAQKIAAACRLMEDAESPPALAPLARAVGASPHHFHRRFKSALGITPKAYATALQNGRVRAALTRGATVTEALYEAGFSSSGRFYSGPSAALGMAPGTIRKGGASEVLTFAAVPCSQGQVLVAASEKGVCAILLGDDPDDLADRLRTLFPQAALEKGGAAFAATAGSVVDLVDTPDRECGIPLDIRGTAFQQRVWQALKNVPPGKTVSYSELAAAIGAPQAARAVASACAANKLAVAIPCHRVVRQDGSLSGYRWGPDRKRALLAKELDKELDKEKG